MSAPVPADLFGRAGQAEAYVAFRPRYPPAVLHAVGGPSGPASVAVDLCSGPGTVAVALAEQMAWSRILAVDRSTAQLRNAPKHPAVEYVLGDALAVDAALPGALRAGVELICIGQGLHWFDTPHLMAGLAPWLHPQCGRVVVLGYDVSLLDRAECAVVYDGYHQFQKAVEPYWSPQCKRGRRFGVWVLCVCATVPPWFHPT
jgi:hypothetical protein